MNQAELEQAVARSTGESLREIRRRGFSAMQPAIDDDTDSDDSPQIVDWDALDQSCQRAA